MKNIEAPVEVGQIELAPDDIEQLDPGDIIIDGDDIFGDGVNIAARLEALAKPGEVCVSESAHMHVRSRLDVGFEDRSVVVPEGAVELERSAG